MCNYECVVLGEQLGVSGQCVHEQLLVLGVGLPLFRHPQPAEQTASVSVYDEDRLVQRIQEYVVGRLVPDPMNGQELGT